jgi:CYTH domain-containing protein
LNRDHLRTVRVRIADSQAFLTIKGPNEGIRRQEFEYPIPLADADALLALCEGPLIEKHRHRVVHGGLLWEIDEFHGANAGLVVAEVELPSVEHPFEAPPWLGREVSHDPRYFNSSLSRHPFSTWDDGGAGS